MKSPESSKEQGSILFFVDHYYCPDSKLSPPTCRGHSFGDGGVAIVDNTGQSMQDYGNAFAVVSEHAPNCPSCEKKMIPQIVSKPQNTTSMW